MTHQNCARTLFLLTALFVSSCNSKRGESRDEQLEQTAESLEAKAEKVRFDVEKSAEEKISEAKEILEKTGDKDAAKALENDASVTRKVGKMRAEQLEEQAEKVREQKLEPKEAEVQKAPE